MNNTNRRAILVASMMVLAILFSNFTTVSYPIQSNQKEEMITITATDMISNTQSQYTISKEMFLELFYPTEKPKTTEELAIFYQQKLNILHENGMLSPETKAILTEYLDTLIQTNRAYLPQPKGPLFDVVNLFNGIFFALKGEKTASFLDLPVLQFPFFNDNITALFSGFSRYTGNGFIFTLGTVGFQYTYGYDTDAYEFPYFPPIRGTIIGFTGVILETEVGDTFGEQYEGSYSIGIGMNIFTVWNAL